VKIGFIGLDIMGKPMAKNLMKAGHQLVVSTRNAAAAVEFAGLGADTAASPRDIAEQVELVITMLPNSPQVKEVALGPGGIVEAARPGLVFIDMSSIAPLASREIHGALAEKGVAMLDAPVSGGEPKAIDGTLSVMVGGDKGIFDEVVGVLDAVAASVVHAGPIGAGITAKLANQVVVALNIAAVSEALVLAQKAGTTLAPTPRRPRPKGVHAYAHPGADYHRHRGANQHRRPDPARQAVHPHAAARYPDQRCEGAHRSAEADDRDRVPVRRDQHRG
jgi:2-hydroxy-3-oxopropionate reductase